jgi:steroid 5-alpha reductase family enzyme
MNMGIVHGLFIWMAQGTAVIAVFMFILWLLHFPLRNAAVVDVGWAMGLALLAMIYAVHGAGYWRRTLILLPMVVVWGLRLGFYLLFTRVNGQPEEGRYVELRRKWGTHIGLKFLAFFEFQALLCGVLSLPFLLALHDPLKGIEELETAGAWTFAVAFLGELTADWQLSRFKRNPNNKGKVCNVGLWRYSRHPNYFFEWLIWVSFALVASSAQYGYWGFLSPALILYFLLRVSGIPATEEQAVRSKGDAYRKYQKSTSPFIPWFPNYK